MNLVEQIDRILAGDDPGPLRPFMARSAGLMGEAVTAGDGQPGR